MANWYYFDNAGTRQGPFTDEQIGRLIEQRVIVRQTRLETEAGRQGLAEQVARFRQKIDFLPPPPVNTSAVFNGFKEYVCGCKTIFGCNPIIVHFAGMVGLVGIAGVMSVPLALLIITYVTFSGIRYRIKYREYANLPDRLRNLLQAAGAGDTEAKTKLGEYYYEERKEYDSQYNVNRAIACYKRAAEYGHTEARRILGIVKVEYNARFNDRYNGNIQEPCVGIGRIVVFISVALGVVSYFLPCEKIDGMNAFQGYQFLLKNEKGDSPDALFGIAFLVFIYPVFMAVIKKSLILNEQIGGFVSGIAGIVLGIILIVNCDAGMLGNAAGAGVYIFILACVGLIAGMALYNCRLP
ncbi:hypothetical protein FACS189454_09820 [Planctomycetales bacterium]|nr:hypothetical protein FACS189454_09820 [Planctomycetales bacterium]